jgi:hypothetical protein
MADYKAVSMNLMHESIEITDSTYAPMLSSDVQERIAGLSGKATSTPGREAPLVGDELEIFLNKLDRESQKKALMFIAGKLAQ